mmetsp:Transcript_21014/g.44354  ORF Transcript_21014/g.44354 Transcript_21014/m.44354 type:complete len:223 (+) Transcript_21014:275-943(+)|eukprot:CAMPEP_0183712074 /NCGR_PEP_ID=MMETSP0737-20130205/7333_1 /TAXON_ID=385413 /ORGANISM="Thalassiosira miniscula, Strain CCMP1093" /LENGTH=222 /DNA_ID=CAMNT_0025940651 /DNA_START=215 /DNA_END=883 /DNA_ORIENTATION=+
MSPPIWAGTHGNETISSDRNDYIFFLSKDDVPYGCFSNAYREKEGHTPLNSSSSVVADENAASSSSSSSKKKNFWCINQELHYQKAILFEDHDIARQILEEEHDASKIKQLGRLVKGYDDGKWCEVRYDVCRDALHAKFGQNEELKNVLLQTGEKILLEAARDKVWGVGVVEYTKEDDADGKTVGAKNRETGGWDVEPKDWVGENLLGRCLMDVRSLLANSS